MVASLIVQGWDDNCRPTIANIAQALEKLRLLKYDLDAGCCSIEVPKSFPEQPAWVASLHFAAANGDHVRIDLPMLEGCHARTTLGAPVYLLLEKFDEAEVDALGNVRLRDGSSVHAVYFETVKFPEPWTDLDEAIVWLTIRAFKAKHIFLRHHYRAVGIDYGILPIMHEPNVKGLTQYINEHIGMLKRAEGKPPFRKVPISRVHRVLNIAGIRKVRGRKRPTAA